MNERGLNKKLAEWAGFKKADSSWVDGIWKYPFDGTGHGIVDQSYQKLPDFTQSLDACFKWLVPEAVELLNKNYDWDKKGCLNRILKDWQRIYWNSKGILSYALSLCLVIEKLIDGGIK